MKKREKIVFIFIFLVFWAMSVAVPEPFRVHKLFPITITDDDATEQTVTTGINDSVAIFLPDELVYCEGIEINIQIPDEVAQWRDSVICSIYENITPVPTEKKIDYNGTRFTTSILPMRTSWAMQIPFKKENTIRETAFAEKLNKIPDISKGFIFIRVQPAMKGIPNETLEAKLKISVRPLLINKGKFVLAVNADKPYNILIDDKQVSENISGSFLDAGAHTVSIVSEHYRNETRTIRIDQGKTTSISVTMRSIEPTLLIHAPENATVFLDEEPVNQVGKEVPITEGNHRIRFHTNSYEVIKEIFVQNGKSYTASLSMEVMVTEE